MRSEPDVIVRGGPGQPAGRATANSNDGSAKLKEALTGLGFAADQKHVEPICIAYQALRAAAMGMSVGELIAAIGESLGPDVMTIIVSAYSHRQCFMCSAGRATCDQCNGTGLAEEGRPCPFCDGLGVYSCDFCRGTGWADRDTVPPELRRAVLERQLSHVRRDLEHLRAGFDHVSSDKLLAAPKAQRRQTMQWLMRMRARLSNMLESGVVSDESERELMQRSADRINQILEPLRS